MAVGEGSFAEVGFLPGGAVLEGAAGVVFDEVGVDGGGACSGGGGADDVVAAYLSQIGASSVPAAVSTPEPTAAPRRSPNAVGIDGSEYPPEAAWAVPELPPRVRQGGDRTVAKLKIGSRPIPGDFRSGQRDRWSREAAERIRSLGVNVPDYLAHHVEIRAAAMLVEVGIRSATVAINNVPCGYQTPPPGCHQLLEAFLPEGSDVTVQGTDRKGRPYQRTYHGRAKR